MLETEIDGDIETDVATDVEDVEVDDTTTDDEISYDQAMKWKKDSESLQKANKKIASMEKTKKAPESIDTANLSEDALDALLEKRDFYKGNTQAKEMRNEIEAMITASNGKVDRQKAFDMLSGDSEVEENRKVYGRTTVESGRTNTVGFSPIAMEKYDKLSSAEQDAYNAKSKAKNNGGVIFK